MQSESYTHAHKNALQVQDACNFSGVLMSFFEDMEAVREQLRAADGFSSRALARHPVCILYMDKLADLQGRPAWTDIAIAWDACQQFTPAQVPTPAKQEV